MIVSSPLLAALPGVRHAFFTRQGGVSRGIYAGLNGGIGSKDDPASVAENRDRMARALDLSPERLLTLYQVHSHDVVTVEAPWAMEARPRADALVTGLKGVALGVTAADCGPVLFADPEAQVIGAAHAGWKGALTGILEATVEAMVRLGGQRNRIHAAIGPLIRQPSYEVGDEFVGRFVSAEPANTGFFVNSSRPGHAQFDLAGFIRSRLQAAGVSAIDDTGIDTYPDDNFFSYRRSVHRGEPDYGRHVHAIALTD